MEKQLIKVYRANSVNEMEYPETAEYTPNIRSQ
jgi:hypothetical protein